MEAYKRLCQKCLSVAEACQILGLQEGENMGVHVNFCIFDQITKSMGSMSLAPPSERSCVRTE